MTTAIMPGTLAPSSAPPFESRALLNLLIVDDDRLVREACREAATSLGYRATSTDSAEQALWLVESQSIDGVLLGLKLSDPARVALLRQIKQRRPGVEVVVMTTNAAGQPSVEAMKAGAFDYLIKPFGLQEVKLVLDAVSAQLKAKVETRRLGEKIKCNGFGGITVRRKWTSCTASSPRRHRVLTRC
jgi:two-component system response regulator AtoC